MSNLKLPHASFRFVTSRTTGTAVWLSRHQGDSELPAPCSSESQTSTLGLFGCARTTLVETGEPKISLVFPPGGFMRGRGWAVPESSKIPLSFPPEKQLVLFCFFFFPQLSFTKLLKKSNNSKTSGALLARDWFSLTRRYCLKSFVTRIQ